MNPRNPLNNTAFFHPVSLRLFVLLLLVGSGLWQPAAAAQPASAVGEVSLVIGVARLIGADGQDTAIDRGTVVRPGDRIETATGGHVHLRFVDGAFVSVRPDSRLHIETYRYDPAHPQGSAIRFNLEHGVARSITGRGGEAAREHFRLNTPIAAIGVKGTDFVVQALADQVRVAVHTGAVVLSPFGEGCQANAFGPCDSATARLLSADMGRVMLELRQRQNMPRLVPADELLAPEKNGVAAASPQPSVDEQRAGGRRAEITNETIANRQETNPGDTTVPDRPPQLVWGRYNFSAQRAGDLLTVPRDQAAEGRHITVGDFYYGLYRETPTGAGADNLAIQTGQARFALRDAQVHLVGPAGATPGKVESGWLAIDFGARLFSTGLALTHPDTGPVDMTGAGVIRSDGVFTGVAGAGANARVSGALALDGREAAYLFERAVAGGTLSGITRWSR